MGGALRSFQPTIKEVVQVSQELKGTLEKVCVLAAVVGACVLTLGCQGSCEFTPLVRRRCRRRAGNGWNTGGATGGRM